MTPDPRLIFALLAMSLLGCPRPQGCGLYDPPRHVPESPPPQPRKPYHEAFGQRVTGFVDWMSADGRYVILYRFVSDTNGDGEVAVHLGDHGETTGDEPIVEVHDLVDGSFDSVDSIVVTGPRQQYFVMRNGERLFLFDTATGAELELPADPSPDVANPCLPSRQAVFGPAGDRLAFRKSDGVAGALELVSGEVREFTTDDLLWRVGAPPLTASVILQTIPADTDGDGVVTSPAAKSSCSNRWGMRFASSLGRYGWSGDKHVSVMVWPDGSRTEFAGNLVPIGKEHAWSGAGGITTRDGVAVDPPRGCQIGSIPLGSPRIVVQCGPHLGIWEVESNRVVMLEERGTPAEPVTVPARPDSAQTWVALIVKTDDGDRVARLELQTGAVELGPRADAVGAPHPSGWLLTTRRAGPIAAFNLMTGESNERFELVGRNPRALAVRGDDGWYTVDPTTGRTLQLELEPEMMSGTGCVVTSSSRDVDLDVGPWRRDCP